jgi:hypothetical protein
MTLELDLTPKPCPCLYLCDPLAGMFSEAYIIFSVGLIKPLQSAEYPTCFNSHEVCSPNLSKVENYVLLVGIIAGESHNLFNYMHITLLTVMLVATCSYLASTQDDGAACIPPQNTSWNPAGRIILAGRQQCCSLTSFLRDTDLQLVSLAQARHWLCSTSAKCSLSHSTQNDHARWPKYLPSARDILPCCCSQSLPCRHVGVWCVG